MQVAEVFLDMIFRDNNTASRLRTVSRMVDSARNKFNSFSTNMLLFGQSMTQMGSTVYHGITVPIIKGIANSVMAASDLNESFNVVDTTFKNNSKTVRDWAKTLLENYGLIEIQGIKYAGSMGAMLKSSGLSEKAAMKLSMKLTELNGDFASFYNLSHEESWVKIRAGMSGEIMPLRSLGINMSVANLEAHALTMGIKDNWKEMKEADKVMVRYSYLMKVSKDAQGDFSRTQDAFANQVRILQGRITDLSIKLGQVLLPHVNRVVKFFVKLVKQVGDLPGPFKTFLFILSLVAASIGPIIVIGGVLITVVAGLAAAIGTIGLPATAALAAIAPLLALFVGGLIPIIAFAAKLGILKKAIQGVKAFFMIFSNFLKGDVKGAVQILIDKFGISSERAKWFTTQMNSAKAAINKVIGVVKNVRKLIGLMFDGNNQKMINLLVSKFGLSTKEAVKFAKKVMALKEQIKNFASKVKYVGQMIAAHLIIKLKQAAKYVYNHRAAIVKAISTMISFGSKTITVALKIYNAYNKIKNGAKVVYSYLKSGAKGVINVITKLKNAVSKAFSGIKSTASSVVKAFGNIKYAIVGVISKIGKIKFPSPPSWFPGFAAGVTNFGGGLAIVGEEGPEIVRLPRGSDVIPNNRVKDIAKSDMKRIGLTTTTNNNNISINMYNTIHENVNVTDFFRNFMNILKMNGVVVRNG